MAPDPDEYVAMLSDNELLDSIEKLLCAPGFVDLDLGYDPASRTFYAGCEVAGNLRDLLRSILRENRPSALSLQELIGHSCASLHSVRAENGDKAPAADGYLTLAHPV